VGLKQLAGLEHPIPDVEFQTNPRGVEADRVAEWSTVYVAFQTNPRGVEALRSTVTTVTDGASFRRTLVGLKRVRGRRGVVDQAFQTNPRGVEALRNTVTTVTTVGFRRTLVGLKPT